MSDKVARLEFNGEVRRLGWAEAVATPVEPGKVRVPVVGGLSKATRPEDFRRWRDMARMAPLPRPLSCEERGS